MYDTGNSELMNTYCNSKLQQRREKDVGLRGLFIMIVCSYIVYYS